MSQDERDTALNNVTEEDLNDMEEGESDVESETSEDRAFAGNDDEEWEVDNDLLRASSEDIETNEAYRGVQGGTKGLRRYFAMIASIERRAQAIEEKKKSKSASSST